MIGVTRDGHVMTLEMQRAERRNALNVELVDSLRDAVEKAASEDIRAIVLTGQGHVFSAGADLTDAAGMAEQLPDKAKALNLAIDAAPVPVIGAINGPAIGAGVILSMICDLRVVAPEAYFQFPVAKYGLALDNWSIRRLTSLVGAGRARGMLLAAERLTADAALQTGMANRIGTLADAQAWATEIAGYAPLALQHAKRVLNDDGAYAGPVARAHRDVRQGMGQSGRDRGAGGAHRKAATEVPGRLMMRAALRFGFGTASLLAGSWLLRALRGAPAALGATPAEIERVAHRSPNFQDGVFVNTDPAAAMSLDREQQMLLVRELVGGRDSGKPGGPIPLAPAPADAAAGPLSVRWYGHSSALVEVDGYRVLADPVWSRRCSPSHTLGPQRLHEVPVPLEALPAVDAVMISHDHYDHLDIDTITGLAHTQRAPFVVPLGVGAHLRKWGIPEQPHRRTGLAREPPDRRPDAGLHTRTALLGSVVLPQHHAVGVVGDRGTQSPRVLRRRHRLHQELRRDRRGPRAFRPDAAADRRVSPGVAGHPHEPRGCDPCSPRRRRGRLRVAGTHSLGDVPAGPAPVVGAGRASSRRRRSCGRAGGGAKARAACRSRVVIDVRPVVAVLSRFAASRDDPGTRIEEHPAVGLVGVEGGA